MGNIHWKFPKKLKIRQNVKGVHMEKMDYKKAGVDIHAGYEAVERMK